MSTRLSAGSARQIYKFIEAHRHEHSVQVMCRVLGVARSGYYDWLKQPISNHAKEDARLLRLIRTSFVASHGIYGAPRAFLDLSEAGETCSKHRVARLMRRNNLRALHGAASAACDVLLGDSRVWSVDACACCGEVIHRQTPPRCESPPAPRLVQAPFAREFCDRRG